MYIYTRKKIILLAFFVLLSMFCVSGCSCNESLVHNDVFTAEFVIGETVYSKKDYGINSKVEEILPEERTGYVFKGWYMDKNYTVKWNFDSDIITANTVFYGYYVPVAEETFNILYYDNDLLLKSETVPKYGTAEQFIPDNKSGYIFKGWYLNGIKYNFNQPITSDVSVIAKFELIVYHIKFIADGVKIKEAEFTVENFSVEEPDVPLKDYYAGSWNEYELELNDMEVNAKYTPIIYKTEYIVDGETFKIVEFSILDTPITPEVPFKRGYKGVWTGVAELGKNNKIYAEYSIIEYKITYVVGNEILQIIPYTVLNNHVTAPKVPSKAGYYGFWQDVAFDLEDVTVKALYEPITYYVTFISEGETVLTQPFTVENKQVTIPPVPLKDKAGYLAKWQPFTLGLEDVTVYSIYEPIIFNAKFYVDNVLLSSIEFTVEDEKITPPPVPEKEGYTGEWQQFEIQANNLAVNAVYTAVIYYITFISYESEIKIPYTVENRNIDEPTPAMRKHYNVKWQDYSLTTGDLTVNAIYTPIVKDEFNYKENNDGTLTVIGYYGTDTDILIPSEHGGKKVKSIGELAFNCGNVTEVELCFGIEIIEQEAFLQCEKLTKIIFPKSLKIIDKYAFAFTAISELTFPDGITEIGAQAFAYTPVKSIKLPKNLNELDNSFYYCRDLENFEIGNGVKVIKTGAFEGCESLKCIYIPETVTLIEPEVFNKSSIEEIEFENVENWFTSVSGELNDLQSVPSEKLTDKISACQILIAQSLKFWYHKHL